VFFVDPTDPWKVVSFKSSGRILEDDAKVIEKEIVLGDILHSRVKLQVILSECWSGNETRAESVSLLGKMIDCEVEDNGADLWSQQVIRDRQSSCDFR
jgi:hypothetical protein